MFLLPLILSFLPILAGYWEGRKLEELAARRADTLLQQKTTTVASRLKEATGATFWPGEIARRLARRLESPRRRQPLTAAGFGRALENALRTPMIQGPPPMRIWAVQVTATSPLEVELCRGKGLQTQKASIYRSLLLETLKKNLDLPSELDTPIWENRLGTMFGEVISPAFFSPGFRGRAFPSSLPEGCGFAVWEIVWQGRTPIGAFLILLPPENREVPGSVPRAILNWRDRQILPAVIGFPTLIHPPRPKLWLHPALSAGEPLQFLTELHDLMVPAPPKDLGKDGLGNIWLPTSLEGRILHRGDWWFRVGMLDHEAGGVGVLAGKLPPPGWLNPTTLSLALGMALALFWALLLVRGYGWQAWPDLKIGQKLLLWFGGLASIPLVIGFVAGVTFLLDHEENLKEALAQEIRGTLAGVDSESARLLVKQEMYFRKRLEDKTLGTTLRDLQNRQDFQGLKEFKASLWSQFQRDGLDLMGMVFHGHHGFLTFLTRFNYRQTINRSILDMFRNALSMKMGPEPPKDGTALSPGVASPPTRLDWGDAKHLSEGTTFSPAPFSAGSSLLNQLLGDSLGRTSSFVPQRLNLGQGFAMELTAPINVEDHLWGFVAFIWNQATAISSFLKERLPAVSSHTTRLELPFQIGAFRIQDRVPHPIFPATFPPGLEKVVAQKWDAPTLLDFAIDGKPGLLQVFPCQRMEGITLVGFAPLEPLRQTVIREAASMAGLLFLIILMVAGAARALSDWLAAPLIRMSRGLDRIAQGDLTLRIGEVREDELGQAGLALDEMTRSLRERRALTRFVSPQALEAVVGGDPGRALHARRRQVVVLVSDVRGFTTLSERFPPQEVFAALNDHLKVMTTIIQDGGGVIDRFIGDAIVAVFYAEAGANPEGQALEAARAMMEGHSRLLEGRLRAGRFGYGIGIGIDTGEVLAGAIGDPDVRLDYTVLGEPAALAAHLEGLSKKGRASRIIVSNRFRARLPAGYEFIPVEGESGVWEAAGGPAPQPTTGEVAGCPFPVVGKSTHPADSPHPDPTSDPPPLSSNQQPTTDNSSPTSNLQPTADNSFLTSNLQPTTDNSSPTSNQQPTTDNSGHAPSFILAFWVLGIALALTATLQLWTTEEWSVGSDLRQELVEATGEVVGDLSPEIVISQELRTRLEKTASDAVLPGAKPYPVLLSEQFSSMRMRFPGLEWAMATFITPPIGATATFDRVAIDGGSEFGTPNARWSSTNVGLGIPPAPPRIDGDRITMTGGGLGLLMATDSFRFFHRPVPQDSFRITARLLSLEATHPRASLGIMAREGGGQGARFVALDAEPDGRIRFASRSASGEGAFTSVADKKSTFPLFVQLTKLGPQWTAEVSPDGHRWTVCGSATLALGGPAEVGLTVCAAAWGDDPSPEQARIVLRSGFSSLPDAALGNVTLTQRYHQLGLVQFMELQPTPAFWKWWEVDFPRMIGDVSERPQFFADTYRAARWIPLFGRQQLCYTNLLGTEVDGPPRPGQPALIFPDGVGIPPDNSDVLGRWGLWNQIRGGVFLAYDPGSTWVERTAGNLSPPLASAGILLALVEEGRPLFVPQTAPEFLPGGVLNPLIGGRLPGVRRFGDWVVCTSSPMNLLGKQVQAVLAKRIRRQEVLARLSVFPWVFFGVWLLLGLAWPFRGEVLRRAGGLGLRERLVATFLLALLPALAIGFLIVARWGSEAKTRVKTDARNHLGFSLERFENGAHQVTAWVRHLFRQETSALVRRNPFRNGPPPEVFRARMSRALRSLLIRMARKGVLAVRAFYSPGEGEIILESSNPTSSPGREAELWGLLSRILQTIGGRELALPAMGRTKDSATGFFLQAESENIKDAFLLQYGEETAAHLFLRDEVWTRWEGGHAFRTYLFMKEFRHPSERLFRLAIDPGSGVLERPGFYSLTEGPLEFRQEQTGFQIFVHAFNPSEMAPPFFQHAMQGHHHVNTRFYLQTPNPAFRSSLENAFRNQEPVAKTLGSGQQESFLLFHPSQTYSGFVICGRVFLGRLLEKVQQNIWNDQLLLIGLMVLIYFLARGVARQFLGPVQALVTACRAVAAGDYSARLPEHWSGEFALLAGGFNRMAREAQEGRLLGKFVSDSVLELASRSSRGKAVPEGEARRVIILFAQLAGFKQLLETSEPEALLADLNRYLKTMSRIIRDRGGEIDKFIGDRILAVFHPDANGDLTAAATTALRTAREMRLAMPPLKGNLPVDLGVGLVAGTVLAGILGVPEVRLEFTVIGDTVNLASRLSDAAGAMPGGAALVESGIEEILAGRARGPEEPALSPLPAILVKGKAREIGILKVEE